MTKTKEELDALKEEVETLNKKLAALSDEEIKQVSAGTIVVCQRFVNSQNVASCHGDCNKCPYVCPYE